MEERLYVLTHETIKDSLRRRVEPILEGRNPELPQGRGLYGAAARLRNGGLPLGAASAYDGGD